MSIQITVKIGDAIPRERKLVVVAEAGGKRATSEVVVDLDGCEWETLCVAREKAVTSLRRSLELEVERKRSEAEAAERALAEGWPE